MYSISQSELNGFDTEGISVKNLSKEKLKRSPKVHIAENKGENTMHQNMIESDSKFDKNYAQNKNFQTKYFSSVHAVCCKCHSQRAKCTNCRCKKSGNHCTVERMLWGSDRYSNPVQMVLEGWLLSIISLVGV